MSTMAKTTKPRRARRQLTDEFKAGAVRLVLDEGQTVGRVARGPRSGSHRVGGADLGRARPGRPHEGSHRRHARGTRGAPAPPEREPDSAGGAGDPPKGGHLLRDRAAVRFEFIARRRRTIRSVGCAAVCESPAAASMPGGAARSRPAAGATVTQRSWCGRRLTRVSSDMVARGFTRISWSRPNG